MHVIGTAGHVDHGKSSLVEQLTGIDPDRFAEEKARGLTIDLGFAWMELPSGDEVGIIDVPGHERFIRNMLAGAGGITICLFVVAANEGWMRQSAEHLAIIDLLGIRAGVVAITKSDTVDAGTLERVSAEVRAKLDGTGLASAPIVACSVVTGDGLGSLVEELAVVVRAAAPAADHGRPRLWVDRVFTIAGAGTVVTGTLAGGALAVDDAIEILPSGRKARLRSIQSHKKEVETIGPGNRVALNIAGLDRVGAARGDAIVRAGHHRLTRRIDVSLRASGAPDPVPIGPRGAYVLHVGSAETPVRIRLIGTDRIDAGSEGFARLSLRDPLPLVRGDRFIVRDVGRTITIGGGEILDPAPGRGDTDGRSELLSGLVGADPVMVLDRLVDSAGMLDRSEALYRSGAVAPGPGVVELGAALVSPAELARQGAEIRSRLADFHRAHPLEGGMPKELLRTALDLAPSTFDALVDAVAETERVGSAVKLAAHGVRLDPAHEAARTTLMQRLEDSGYKPPAAAELGTDPALVKALAEAGDIVRVGDFYLTAAQARGVRRSVRDRIESHGPQTVAAIKDLLGTTRKYAVPLCEWLDATGATIRRGDERVLGPTP